MEEQIKKELIRSLYQLRFIINDSYPDDDDFWNNYRQDVEDVYNKLEEIEKYINNA